VSPSNHLDAYNYHVVNDLGFNGHLMATFASVHNARTSSKAAVLPAGLISEVLILKYFHRRGRAPCFRAGAIRGKDRAENLAIGLGRGMSIEMKYPEFSGQAQGWIEVDMI
jgi:hypothetical protein